MNNDIISRSALKKHKFTTQHCDGVELEDIEVVPVAAINNTPTIETTIEDVISMLSENSLEVTEWFKVDTPSGKEVIFEKRETGWWLPQECGFYWYRQFACSKCGHEIISAKEIPNYCQKCGTKMKGIYNEQKTADTSL